MNCIIPADNLKIISKVLQTLAKVGDELYMEIAKDHLQLATINLNKTAFCKFRFNPTFFTNFSVENDEKTMCNVHLKFVCNVFNPKNSKEKKVDYCRIDLEDEASKIVFKLKYKHDVTVVHNVRLIDKNLINVDYDLGDLPNEICATGAFLQQILGNFQNNNEDMNMEIKDENVIMRNYDVTSTLSKGIRSQIVLQSTEFLYYKIRNESNVTMSFKPIRAAAHFCEGFNLNVILKFDSGGKPIILRIQNPTFEANFVLSTLNPNGESQSCISSENMEKVNITIEDQNAIENINWDSDFEMNDDKSNIINNVINKEDKNDEVIPSSPESPRSKRIKLVFGRCFETTFQPSQVYLGKMLAPDSDPE